MDYLVTVFVNKKYIGYAAKLLMPFALISYGDNSLYMAGLGLFPRPVMCYLGSESDFGAVALLNLIICHFGHF